MYKFSRQSLVDATDAAAGCYQEVKKVRNDAKIEDEALRTKFSLDLDLVTEDKDDARIAELMQFSAVECKLVLCVFFNAYYYMNVCKNEVIPGAQVRPN